MKLFHSKTIKYITVSFFCASISWVGAQTKEIAEKYRAKYPGQQYIQMLHQEVVRIDVVKSKPVVTSSMSDQYLVLTSNGAGALTEDDISFSSFETIKNIDAYSLNPTEKGSKKVPASNFKTKDAETDDGIFHDGGKETTFMYPGLVEGSLRVLNYDNQMGENRFPFGFYFANYIPVEKSTFTIDCDSSIHLLYKTFNFESENIQFEEKLVKGRRIWIWTCLEPKPVKRESNAPKYSYYAPLVYAQIGYQTTKSGRINFVSSLDDLHNWYKENIDLVLKEKPSDELIAITQELTASKSTEIEKVKAIYYWVQDNIKYIAFEEGMGGFVPRIPSEVCSKRFGDCKDMATLIYTMLKISNIPSYITWIGSRDLPFKYSEFPSTISDNHMICVYKNNGKNYFLDATSSFQPLDYPTGFILGKEAFLHIDDSKWEVLNVDIPAPNKTIMIDTTRIRFESKKIFGSSHTTITGYYNVLLHDLVKHTPADKMNKTFESINQKGNNNYKVVRSSVQHVDDRDLPLILIHDFEVDNYVTSYDKETYVNLILEKDITAEKELKEGRRSPFELHNYSSDSYNVVLEIPKGMKVKSIPSNVEFISDFVDYRVIYTQKGNEIIMSLNMNLKFLVLYPTDFPTWNAFVKLMKKSMNETVVLEKTI